MNHFSENNLANDQLQKNMELNFDLAGDDEFSGLVQFENRIFDLQKEDFNNVRNLIVAAAAIASVDLLAFEKLKSVGLEKWIITSVIFLYLSSIISALYLTFANNVQVRLILELKNFVKSIISISKDKEVRQIEGMEEFLQFTSRMLIRFTKGAKTMYFAVIAQAIANGLFAFGLLIPIFGFVIYLFS